MQPLSWTTLKSFPAIVNTADRCGPVFASTVNLTIPLPVPEAPLVILSHGVFVGALAVHPQPLSLVVTLTVLSTTPAAGTFGADVGFSVYVQPLS